MEVTIENIQFYRNSIGKFFKYIIKDLSDPRTHSLPLMDNPTAVATILIFYIYFVIFWGPTFMKNRKPFELKNTLILYNFAQVLISAYLSYYCLFHAYIFGDYSLRCQPIDWTRSYSGMLAVYGSYYYFLAKLTELFDTVFFVLRKKDNQISFLHVVHHGGMLVLSYGVTKYYPGGNIVFYGMVNSMVHTVMYTYYLLSSMGPEYQKYLWWKKYITRIQMIQFCMGIVHMFQLFYTNCGFPRWTLMITLPNAIFMYFMFYDFYQAAYKKRKEMLAKQAHDAKENGDAKNQEIDKKSLQSGLSQVHFIFRKYHGLLKVFSFVYVLFMVTYPHFEA